MPYTTQTYIVFIASPSDVNEEREAAKRAIHEWNALNAKAEGVTLDPHMWETHATPAFGAPQDIINEQLVKDADLLIGMFWTKIGTKTKNAPSGTVEEIERMVAAGKRAMLYFSDRPVPVSQIDQKQLTRLKKFKDAMFKEKRALVGSFTSPDGLRQKLKDDLTRCVRELKQAHVPTHPAPAAPPQGDRLHAMLDRVEAVAHQVEADEAAGRARAAEQHAAFVKRLERDDFGGVAPYRSLALSVIPLRPKEPPLDLSSLEGTMIQWMRPVIEQQGMNDYRNTQTSYVTMLKITGAGPDTAPAGACELTEDGSFFTACDMISRYVLLGNPVSNGAVFKHPNADKDDDLIHFRDVQQQVVRKVIKYVGMIRDSGVGGPYVIRLSLVGVGGVKLLVNGATPNAKMPERIAGPNVDAPPAEIDPTDDLSEPAVAERLHKSFHSIWRASGQSTDPYRVTV